MARNGSGTYTAPANSVNPAVATTTIDDTDFNTLIDDLETALTESIARDGQTTTTAVVPFASGVKTDTVVENSANTGVTVDGVLLKDSTVKTGTIVDTNSNEALILGTTASAVNEITITNSATGNAVSVAATGDDTNISINWVPKGNGVMQAGGISLTRAVLVFSSASTLAGNQTVFYGTTLFSLTETDSEFDISIAGTLRSMYVKSSGAVGAGETTTFTLRKNAVGTAIATTISGASQTSNNDTVNTVAVAAGDTLSVSVAASAGAATVRYHISIEVGY